jgi:hypothetical protein
MTARPSWSIVTDGTNVLQGVNSVDYATIYSTAPGSGEWKDYKVTAKIKAGSSSELKVAAHYQDKDNYYACGLKSGNTAWLGKRLDGNWYTDPGGDKPFVYSSTRFYNITFQLVGNDFTCTITDPVTSTSVTLNYTHDTFTKGTVAVVVEGTGEITNVVVTKIG